MSFPEYQEDGSERLSFENIWRNIDPQVVTGVDCFNPFVDLKPIDNLVSLRLTDVEFREMFSALYNGAEITYPDRHMQIIINFLRGIHCNPIIQEGECTDFPTFANFIDYSPMNPFIDPLEVPEGYTLPPIIVLSDENIADWAGYQLNDIIVPPNTFPLDTGWFDELSGNLPTIQLSLVGSGTAQLRFLSQIGGGLAIVTLDNPPNLVDVLAGIITGADNILDLNLDVISFPPETAFEIDFPVDITEAGDHTIYIVFLPIVDDSLIPLRFGGGFRGVNLCDFAMGETMSCEDIEGCLPDSPTIISIQESVEENAGNITTIENNLNTVGQQVSDQADCGCGGNVYPSKKTSYEPDGNADPDKNGICGSAYYIAQKLSETAVALDEAANANDLEDFMTLFLDLSGFIAWPLKAVWEYFTGAAHPDLADDLADTIEAVTEIIYCNFFDGRERWYELVDTGGFTTTQRDAWLQALGSVSDAQIDKWAVIGSATLDIHCQDFCSWVVVWDFKGDYEAEEGEIVLGRGNLWTVYNGEFVSGTGYHGLLDTWGITHDLPPDCAISQMQIRHYKNAPCASVGESVTWKGIDCLSAEAQTTDGTILSNTPVTADWDLHSCVISNMDIRHNHGFCGGEYGSVIQWVKMTGTGSRPDA